ncbi:hypothetical protein FCL43_022510, partial [Enterobacter hormaechei]|nr:hypothetical protein [Enterobacter hormaechei]
EPLPLEDSAEKVTHNRLTQLNVIRWHYRYDGEHHLTEVISQLRDRNRPRTQVSFRYPHTL